MARRALSLSIVVAAAATLLAAAPVLAQTRTSRSRKPPKALDRSIAAGADGANDEEGGTIGVDVRRAAGLIVDLFPIPGGGGTADGRRPRPRATARRPVAAPVRMDKPHKAAAPAVARARSRSCSPRVAPLTVPPQAVSGDFVPDEVLVTIDGAAADVAEIAATFGLEVRSQRTSELLGVTIVRYGILDGRPVGTVLAQLAGEPRALERVPNHVLVLQQAGAVVNYAFNRISLEPDKASGADVKVAVIDTAVDAKHPALAGVIVGRVRRHARRSRRRTATTAPRSPG